MPPTEPDGPLADAVIQYVEHGSYPDDEDVISAELPAAAYPKLLASVQQARDQVKIEVRSISTGAASDVDTWIAQAKQLQADIERSKATAQEIIQQAEASKKLQAVADDAANKTKLLRSELAFNESLAGTLQQIKRVSGQLDDVQIQIAQEHLEACIDSLEIAVDGAQELSRHEQTRFTTILHDRIARLGAEVRQHAIQCWSRAVVVDKKEGTVTIHKQSQDDTDHDIVTIANALSRLNIQDEAVGQLYAGLDSAVLRGLLSNETTLRLQSLKNTIATNRPAGPNTVGDKLEDITKLLDFLHEKLPRTICFALSEKLVPTISSRLIERWLTPAVPLSVDGIVDFQTTLDQSLHLSEHLRSLELFGANILAEWVEEAPRIWLSRRKEAALAHTRASSFRSLASRKTVERVETQIVPHTDDSAVAHAPDNATKDGDNDDWNDNWDDEGEKTANDDADADEDASAWDMDNEAGSEEPSLAPQDATTPTDEETGDAWGWGEGEDVSQPTSPAATRNQPPKRPQTNGATTNAQVEGTEMTLRESYTVTGIPDSLMDIITTLIGDAEKLSDSRFTDSPIAPAARGLYSIPPLVLGMYRATAAAYYAKEAAGNMLLYNDCSHLAEQLTKLAAQSADSAIGRLRLDSDIHLLTRFGKLAYGREMESQRTILRDLLDGAQAFNKCTVQPFAAECENAVAMTVDRVRDVKMQWDGILSPSALAQSLGNLVSTICAKVILDIEEMSDISEEESKALSSYIAKITTLSELFVQRAPDGSGEGMDTTGVYTPNWFKFQYLGEILESRLADIKYLWQEGELSLEFEVGEVVDLVEALFADSDYRRKAIRDIRASAGQS